MSDATLSRRWRWLLFLLFVAVWFGVLDYRKLIKPDEGRYAEISREMVASGDWLTPRLNGIKYFEKPPLQYWATAAAFRVFGENEWTARLWTALTGFGGVLLAFLVGRRLFGETAGWLSAAILGSSLMYILLGHVNTLDMGLCFFLQLALSGFLLAQRAPPGAAARNWMLLCWLALALGVLSKGIVAPVLAGATLVAYALAFRDFSPWTRLHLLPGLALFLAVAAPWFVAVSVANPEFPRFFFIHEHFERFLSPGHRRSQAWWYFFPILALGTLSWIALMLQGLAAGLRRRDDGLFQPRRFLATWVIVVFAFFSLSSSKLPSYVLPIVPALALLAAASASSAGPRGMTPHAAANLVFAIVALFLAPRVVERADNETPYDMMFAYARWLTACGAVWLGASVAALWLAWRSRGLAAALVLAVGSLLAGTGALLGHESLARSNSSYYLAREVRPLLSSGVPFYAVNTYDQTLPFYLRRTLTLVEYRDELDFGLRQEPHKAVPTVSEFASRWQAERDAFALMTPDTHARLERQGLPMRIVAQDTRRIIVRKP